MIFLPHLGLSVFFPHPLPNIVCRFRRIWTFSRVNDYEYFLKVILVKIYFKGIKCIFDEYNNNNMTK